jgi:hypothetical protein
MVHPFTLHDSRLVHHLSHQGISFDSKTKLTNDLHPLRNALFAKFFPALQPETQIYHIHGKPCGFAQLGHPRGCDFSYLRFLSPADLMRNASASEVIEALLKEAGRRQNQYVLADAQEKTDAYNFLRRGGFSVFARQEIWNRIASSPPSDQIPDGILRPLDSNDTPAVMALYSSVVPCLVQQIEDAPQMRRGWVLYEDGELVGFFHLRSGPLGVWMEPFFHPGARNVADWIATWLTQYNIQPPQQMYVCVRSYQDWVGSILQDNGFALFEKQAVLVRRTVVPIQAMEPVYPAVAEKTIPQATTYLSMGAQKIYDSTTPNHR